MELQTLKGIVDDKRICIIGSLPPHGIDLSQFDIVVRCNDWWAYDEGRCDILFHISSSPKIKTSWLLANLAEKAKPKLVMLFRGAEHNKMKQILGYQRIECVSYDEYTPYLLPLRTWFNNRGHSPSTGLVAIYSLSQCKPSKLHVTGMDLYSTDPTHDGWTRHYPLGHAYWIKKLAANNDFMTIGSDLKFGIDYWVAKDAEGLTSGI